MTLMKDLIHIPEKVQRGDFVLNLSSGLHKDAIDQTLRDYVVTPQLEKSFEDALSFIKSTVANNQNRQKGAYLHGSFGSGKSHFMAVLHLLLQGNTQARSINELAATVSKHDDWLQSKNILLVPYHMIGAASLEAGVLGGYAKHIKKLHPDAPVPGFYMSGQLFKDAVKQRELLGDDAFFQAINSAKTGNDDVDWGDVASGWDAYSFDAVVSGQAPDEDRNSLVSDLVSTLFSTFKDLANTQSGGYLVFDEGLKVMTKHAQSLGYDAVILFLDELILWLASRLSDQQFISTEIQKVVKLVEVSEARALPLVSFIARQRDLREFVGDQFTGAEQEALSDSLKYWDGRFHTITLEDRNLPIIAQRRLLRPLDNASQKQISKAFESTERMREEAYSILLTQQGDREMFRALYPFSPALVQALVALSSALQRERTALKVMLMLLVSQRETLELGNVIPVGDLYDVIGSEAEPFSESMRQHFENAKQLFERKLIPLLEAEHGIVYAELDDRQDDLAKRSFNNDIRLLKTLLLSALVPEIECFKQLTSNKLAALNHGTIKSPIPGQETRTVLNKCRKWAGQVGEIKLSEDSNPIITIQLSGVDTESILEQAQIHDSDGARRKLVKDMVFDEFGIKDDNDLFLQHKILWKGTRRSIEVLFQNIREINDFSTFEARGDEWKVIVDFPFDTGTHTPADDKARIQIYEADGGQTRTLCWLPYFFSQSAQKDLGTLAKLEYILKNDDRFKSHSKDLSAVDRSQARTLLDNQRSQLRQRIKDYLMGAYGASEPLERSLDDSVKLDSQIMSLEPSFTPRLPHGTTLGKAFKQLLGQALSSQYPGHPDFECEVKLIDLGKVFGEIRRAIHATNGRIDIDSPLRPLMRQIAQPLNLGEMHERHFIFKEDWPKQLTRELAKDDLSNEITVKRLREAMESPEPRGLPETVQNLLIQVFAEHGQYGFTLHGGPYNDLNLKEIRNELVLVKQDLAEATVWKQGFDNAGLLFGSNTSNLRTANNQNDLQKEVLEAVVDSIEPCRDLAQAIEEQLNNLGESLSCNRLNNATLAVNVLEKLQSKKGAELVAALADIDAVTSIPALAKSISTAERVCISITDNNWQLLENIWSGDAPEASSIKKELCGVMAVDELVTPLAPALKKAQCDATAILTRQAALNNTDTDLPSESASIDRVIMQQRKETALSVEQARKLLKTLEAELENGVKLDIDYCLFKEGDD